jgi:hypothetical protein
MRDCRGEEGMQRRRWLVPCLMLALGLWGSVLDADTLVMRNGSRVTGRLIGLRDGVFEFEEGRGFRRRVIRVEQGDVRTIELDTDDTSVGSPGDTGASRPRGLREREITVSARTPWTDTGISLRNGQTIYFEANGRIRWGNNRQDGPEGEDNSPRNTNRPIPSRPAAALIGRVGDDTPFFIGGDADGIRVRGSGMLFLGVNDDVFDDNTGSFRVTVYY